MVGMLDHAKFAHFLNGDDAFRWRTLHKQGLEHGGLARAGAAGHQYARTPSYKPFQQRQPRFGEHAVAHQCGEVGADGTWQTYADCRALRHQRRDDRMHPQSFHGGGVGDRAGVIKPSAQLRAQSYGEFANRLRGGERRAQRTRPHALAAIRPDRAVAGHRDIGDSGFGSDVAKGPEFHDASAAFR